MVLQILLSVLDADVFVMLVYGLAAAVFTQNINRAIETAHKLQAGTVWVSVLAFRKEATSLMFRLFPPQDQLL